MPFLLVMERKRLRVDHYPRKRIKSQHHAFNPLLVRFWSRVCISRLHLPGMARPGEYKGQRINLRDGSEEEAVLMVPTTSGNSRNVHNGDGAICETKKIGSAAAKKKKKYRAAANNRPGLHWTPLAGPSWEADITLPGFPATASRRESVRVQFSLSRWTISR